MAVGKFSGPENCEQAATAFCRDPSFLSSEEDIMLRRFLSIAAAAALGVCCVSGSALAEWPDRPVKFLLGSGAGSSIDMVGRVIGQKLSEKFNQPFVATNVSGGGLGAFAMTLKNAKPDGYTIGMGVDSNFTYNCLDPKAKFKMEDYVFVCAIFTGDASYIVAPDKKWKDLREALEESKTAEKPLNYLFQTAQDRQVMEKYVRETGAKVNFIPGQSPSAMVTAIIGGHGDIAYSGGLHFEQDRAGKVRTLTMSTNGRTAHYPDVPSVTEVMDNPFAMDAYRVIVVPKGFPADVLETLQKELEIIVTSDEFKTLVDEKLHFFPNYRNSAELTGIMQKQLEDNRTLWN